MHASHWFVLVALSSAGGLTAQTTWTVPNGAPLGPTLALAAAGDTVQLSGDHPGFTLTKGVTVLGPAIIRDNSGASANTAIAIPAGQTAHFVDVDFTVGIAGLGYFGHIVTVRGDVSFEDCYFSTASTAAIDVQSGSVVLQRCSVDFQPEGYGVGIRGGYCSIVDSMVTGMSSNSPYTVTMLPAVTVTGGVLQASNVRLAGGSRDLTVLSG